MRGALLPGIGWHSTRNSVAPCLRDETPVHGRPQPSLHDFRVADFRDEARLQPRHLSPAPQVDEWGIFAEPRALLERIHDARTSYPSRPCSSKRSIRAAAETAA